MHASGCGRLEARLEARGQEDSGTPRAHKPGCWSQLEAVLERNAGSERWSEGVELPCRVTLDTSGGSPRQLAQEVVARLRREGLAAAAAGT